MTETNVIAVDGDLQWADFDIPGGNMPVRMALLRKEDDTRARTLLVRFPDGWMRPGPGYYEAAEEVIVLTGELHLSGEILRPGDWSVIPARSARTAMRAEGEVLAYARFDAPARYVEGTDGASEDPMRVVANVGALPRSLESTPNTRSWIAPAVDGPLGFDVEAFELSSHRWAFIRAGRALPALSGTCFWRTTDPRGL